MLKGTTKTGFHYVLSEKRLNNYELVDSLGKLESDPLQLSRVVNLLLGQEYADKLVEHVRDDEGLVPIDKLSDEIKDIFEMQKQVKNS